MSIHVQSLCKRFGSTVVCDAVDLEVAEGELVALLGPSGSGKTTLLRMIAGLETPDSGRILFSGQDATHRDVRDRGVGFVFQHYALFPHLTVYENVAFGLRVLPRRSRPGEAAIASRVQHLLQLVQLDTLAGRHPHQLSGGQRQRVALARSLAVEPKVLLLDEPFGALDAKVRKELRRWLRRLHDEVHVTSVFVTHDQEEAMEVADRVVVMNRGRIEQVGPPAQLYDRPATPFVLDFLGDVCRLPMPQGTAWTRPADIAMHRDAVPGAVPGVVTHAYTAGSRTRLELQLDDGGLVEVELPRAEALSLLGPVESPRGQRWWLLPRTVARFEPVDA